MNLRKFTFGLVALIGFGLYFTLNGFKPTEKRAYAYWQFDSNNKSDARTASKYTLITDPETPGCDDGNEMPCVLRVDESIDTEAALSTYLSNTTQFPTNESVTASAYHTKL